MLQGSWSIGVFKGPSPLDLVPLERHEPRQDTRVAWPVANPVLTCASVGDSPSNFGGCWTARGSSQYGSAGLEGAYNARALQQRTIARVPCCRATAVTPALPVSPRLPATVADPFLLRRGDKLYMFYETKSTEQQKGQIGVAVSSNGGTSFQHQAVVLDLPWHLSYPFVFEYNEQVRCIPQRGEVPDAGAVSGRLSTINESRRTLKCTPPLDTAGVHAA